MKSQELNKHFQAIQNVFQLNNKNGLCIEPASSPEVNSMHQPAVSSPVKSSPDMDPLVVTTS